MKSKVEENAKRVGDFYAGPLSALMQLKPKKALSAAETAGALADRLKKWDYDKYGAWQDAAAVLARRNGIVAHNTYVLLVKVLYGWAPQRAHEVGKLIEKMGDRPGGQLVATTRKAGGPKQAATRAFTPPKPSKSRRPKIRRNRKARLAEQAGKSR